MKASRNLAVAVGVAAVISVLVAAQLAQARPTAARTSASPTASGCSLGANGNPVKHVIYLQFDNTHYRRDAAGRGVGPRADAAPPELPEGQRHAVHQRPHDPDLAHRRRDPLSLTGRLPRSQRADRLELLRLLHAGRHDRRSRRRSSTGRIGRRDVRSAAEHDHRRAEDDARTVGALHPRGLRRRRCRHREHRARERSHRTQRRHDAGLRRQLAGVERGRGRRSTPATPPTPGEGPPRPTSSASPSTARRRRRACARATRNAKADPLPDEPGGYTGFQALFGAKYVDPAITGGNACVNDTAGEPITDPVGSCGFPGFDGMFAKQHARLRGSDAGVGRAGHLRLHLGRARPPRAERSPPTRTSSSATGPGEIAHEQQLQDYDNAFAAFFQNLPRTASTRATRCS